MSWAELKKSLEELRSGVPDAAITFYVKIRKLTEKSENASDLKILPSYADFFVHHTVDRNHVCKDLFLSLIHLDLNNAADLQLKIAKSLRFDDFGEDVAKALPQIFNERDWSPMALKMASRDVLLGTLEALSDTQFVLHPTLEKEIQKSVCRDKKAFDSTRPEPEFSIYPQRVSISAEPTLFKSNYRIELDRKFVLQQSLIHTL